MDELNATYQAIDSNSTISGPIKEDIKGLIAIFNKAFKEVSLANFNEKIKNLQIVKGNKYITKEVIEYKTTENTLFVNEDELSKTLENGEPSVDPRHEMMFALLTMISSHDKAYGFDDNEGSLKALNVGFTESLANLLVGSSADEPKRRMKANAFTNLLLEGVVSPDDLTKAYFSNDSTVIKNVVTSSKNPAEVLEAIKKINYEVENEELLTQNSCYGSVQAIVVANMANSSNIDLIERKLINNEQVLGCPCSDIAKAKEILVGMNTKEIPNQLVK